MSTGVTFNIDEAIIGMDIVANAIGGSLGPKGRNVFIEDGITPKVTNDGTTIGNAIDLHNKNQKLGAGVVRNASAQTADDAGDGTSTTAVVLQSTVHEARKRPENPMEIRASLLLESQRIVIELKKQAKKIKIKDIEKVALISSEDKVLARTISEIINQLGKDVEIKVQDSYDGEITYEITDGYKADIGYISSEFVTDIKKGKTLLENALVFVSESKIANISDIKPLYDQLNTVGNPPIVIVCEDIDPSIHGILATNKRIGTYSSMVIIKASGFLLKDIEAYTNATRVSSQTGVTFQSLDIKKHLGKVKKIEVESNKSVFLTDKKVNPTYLTNLQTEANQEHNSYVKDKIEKRIAKLKGKVALLKIGTQDFNREYLKDKADDAIKACKVALEEGVVEGGGMALWRIAQKMKDKTVGQKILKKALTAPLRKICENAGKDYTEIICGLSGDNGYDFKNDKYVNLKECGIIDPTKVERCAVENAISNAANFITSFVTITQYEEPKN